MKILSFGSLNYDYTYEVEHFLAPKETLAAKSMQRGFGGKGANQSIAFARTGLSVYHAGRVGADGQPFVDYLKQNGIHTDYLIKDDAAATGHAIIEVCRGENCILIYGGANQEITTEQIDHTLKAFSPGDWLVLQNEISNLPYLMQAAQKKGLSIFFNAAPYDVGILTYPMELVDVLCVNEVEACALAGTETFEADAVLTLLHEKYPQTRLLLTAPPPPLLVSPRGGGGAATIWMQSGGCLSPAKRCRPWILQLPGTLTAAIFWRAFAAAVQ